MIYAKRVRSPLKGGVDVELGEKVVLWGRNGGGKTAVLQALKLGTKGYVDDQEGQDGVSGTPAIARLFPKGADLEASVEMSDGTEFSWKATRKKTGFTKPKMVQPYDVRFPFHAVKALLSGDDKKIRAWLEKKVGNSLSEEDLLNMLPPAQHDEAKKALGIFTERSPTELAAKLKAEARNLRASSTRKEKTADQIVEGIPLPLSKEQREELASEKAMLWEKANAANTMSPQEHSSLRERIGGLAEALEAVEDQISSLPEPQKGEEETLLTAEKARNLAESHLVTFGHDVCYVCLRGEADVRASYDKWDNVIGELGASRSRQRLQTQYDRGFSEAESLAERYKSANVVDVAAYMAEHSQVAAVLLSDDTNRRVWQQAETVRAEIAGSRASADIFSSLGKTWEKKGQEMLERRKQEFEDKVTAWLPEGEVFQVDLKAGRVGLLVDGEVRTSLSGAESSRLLLAVLTAEAPENGSTPCVLEPEDRGWDPDTLADVMTALADAPDQVVLMSTVLPSKDIEGWKIIEVGA